MSKESRNTSNGVGFFGLLTVAFIVLKLTNVISWSWWWVLAPLWAPLTIALVVVAVVLVVMGIAAGFSNR